MAELNKICRACLNTIEYPKYVFFDNVSPDVFLFCTSIEIVKHEELPKVICDSCYDLLFKLSEFKKTCLQSHKTLLNYSVNSEKLEIFTEALIPPNINKVWSFENTQSLFSNEGNDIDNIVKKEEFEDHNGIDLDNSAVEEFHLPKRKYKVCKRSKEKPAKKKYTCELCNKSFLRLDRFKLHNLRHQKKGKSLECIPCKKIFRTLSGLRRHHASWHASVKLSTVKCHKCGKVTGNRETLKDHMKLHQERRQYICNVCGKGYSTICNLKDHLETHQENRERQYTCEHCGKKFFTKKILVSHMTSCHTGRRFICQICSYPFKYKYNLTQHLLVHEGKKTFKCEVCDKSVSTRSSYIEHQRIHSGERPFICSYCSKSFISKKRLTDHHRIHTGEKPHKCTVCDHSFAQRGTLTRHMKVHNRVPTLLT